MGHLVVILAYLDHDIITRASIQLFVSVWEVHIVVPRFCGCGIPLITGLQIDKTNKNMTYLR